MLYEVITGLKFKGPSTLPFDHDDVRVYLDNLFSEGFLQPVTVPAARATDVGTVRGPGVRPSYNFV